MNTEMEKEVEAKVALLFAAMTALMKPETPPARKRVMADLGFRASMWLAFAMIYQSAEAMGGRLPAPPDYPPGASLVFARRALDPEKKIAGLFEALLMPDPDMTAELEAELEKAMVESSREGGETPREGQNVNGCAIGSPQAQVDAVQKATGDPQEDQARA